MTHPHPCFRTSTKTGKQVAVIVHYELCGTKLSLISLANDTASKLVQYVHAITNPQEWHGDVQHSHVEHRCSFGIHTGRSPGENNPFRIQLTDPVKRHIVRMNFAIDMRFAHTASDQLSVLAAKIENENHNISC